MRSDAYYNQEPNMHNLFGDLQAMDEADKLAKPTVSEARNTLRQLTTSDRWKETVAWAATFKGPLDERF